jgi:hypothetical protein
MTLVASIEHRYTSRRVYQEAFVNLYNFLSSTCAPIGVQLIANNSGSNGTGFGFWDSPLSASHNAWACFKFASATVPFYTLIQYTENVNFGTSPGNPGLADGAAGQYRIAVAVAFCSGGANAWGGTTASNGADTKSTPVWTSASAPLFVFPRSNNPTGSHLTNKENMMTFFRSTNYSQADLFNMTTEGGTGAVTHFFADENNFLFMADPGALGNYSVIYFGKYTSRSDITPDFPYVSMGLYTDSTDRAPMTYTADYGSTAGTLTNTTFPGGIVHPSSSFGVRTCKVLLNALFMQSRYHPNKSMTTASNRYDLHRPQLAIFEDPNHYGYLGMINFFRMGWGIPTAAVSSSGDYAAFNVHLAFTMNRPWNTYLKMIVPWTGSVQPYSLTSRLGVQFTRSFV